MLRSVIAVGILSFLFRIVAYVFDIVIPFFFSLAKTVKANMLENLKNVWALDPFMILGEGHVFIRVSATVVTSQETLTMLTVARLGQVSFGSKFGWTILIVNLLS